MSGPRSTAPLPHQERLAPDWQVIRMLRHDARTFVVTARESHDDYFSGTNTGAFLFLTKNTRNFAGFVLLALRPTTWTSLGPS